MKAYLLAMALLLHPPLNLAIGRGVLSACPRRFGGWNGEDLSFQNAVLEELQADQVLVRRYQDGRDVAWLCIVVHQNRRYGAHDPRVCYESQGYLVGPMTRHHLDDGTPAGLDVNQFGAERPVDRRLVYYWWATPGLATADADAYRERLALRGALDNRSLGAFVRVELLERSGSDSTAARLDDFAGRVARGMPDVFAQAAGGTAP